MSPSGDDTTTPTGQPANKGPRGRQWQRLALAALVLAAAGTGVGGYLWHRQRGPAVPPPEVRLEGYDPAVARAVEEARAAVRERPRSAEAWGRLGMVLMVHEFNAEADFCLEQAHLLDRRDPRWPYLHGVSLSAQDPVAGLAKLRLAVELAADSADRGTNPGANGEAASGEVAARLRLGDLLLRLGQVDEAEAQFEAVLERNPANPHAMLGRGKAELARGQFQAAAARLKAARSDPRTAKAASTLLAVAYGRLGEREQARSAARRAAGLPEDPPAADPYLEQAYALRAGREAAFDRADWLLSRGRTVQALEVLRAATRDYPDSDDAWRRLGEALLAAGDAAGAEGALREAAALNPTSAVPHNHLGVALLRVGRAGEAADCFRESIRLKPGYAEAHYNLGLCLRRRGERGEALEALAEAVRLKPDLAAARRDLGMALVDAGRPEEAREHLQQAVALAPNDAKARETLERLEEQDP